jgi:hypothetical protein
MLAPSPACRSSNQLKRLNYQVLVVQTSRVVYQLWWILNSKRCSREIELNSAQEALHVGPHLTEQEFAVFFSSSGRWHFLYFFPLPHQQISFLLGFRAGTISSLPFNKFSARSNNPIVPPASMV